MISGSPTWNKKWEAWEVVSCVSIPLVHPLYYSLTSPNILAVCRDSRLFCASFTVGCQKGEIPALQALSRRILFCKSSICLLSADLLQGSAPLSSSFAYRCSPAGRGFLAACIPISQGQKSLMYSALLMGLHPSPLIPAENAWEEH